MPSARTRTLILAAVAAFWMTGCGGSTWHATAQDVRTTAQRYVDALNQDDEAALRALAPADDSAVRALVSSNAHRRWSIESLSEPEEVIPGRWYVRADVRSRAQRESWDVRLVEHDGRLEIEQLPTAGATSSRPVDPSAAATDPPPTR